MKPYRSATINELEKDEELLKNMFSAKAQIIKNNGEIYRVSQCLKIFPIFQKLKINGNEKYQRF